MMGSGLEDIAYATPEGVRILENRGNLKFKDLGLVMPADNQVVVGISVNIADMDGDGKKEIIYSTTGKIEIWHR